MKNINNRIAFKLAARFVMLDCTSVPIMRAQRELLHIAAKDGGLTKREIESRGIDLNIDIHEATSPDMPARKDGDR